MKKFLAIYTGSQTGTNYTQWMAQDEATQKKRMDEGKRGWMAWGEANAKAVIDRGGPLGKTKQIGPDGIKDIRNNMSAYVIIEAEDHEAAAKKFLNHPHFSIFPGDAVEVMEILAIPTL
jgi:hypothetical protein